MVLMYSRQSCALRAHAPPPHQGHPRQGHWGKKSEDLKTFLKAQPDALPTLLPGTPHLQHQARVG